jgi:hypothetical protein
LKIIDWETTMNNISIVINPQMWPVHCRNVTRAMLASIPDFATPISISHGTYGSHWGTGNYLDMSGGKTLLSNEHVLEQRRSSFLTHTFRNTPNIYQIVGNHATLPFPVDAGAVRIPGAIWNGVSHASKAISPARFSSRHAPVDGELLFVFGYPGTKAAFVFGSMAVTGIGYCCQEAPYSMGLGIAFDRLTTSGGFDPKYHFVIHHNPEQATDVVGKEGLPLPPGMSGSLVWNTRYVEKLQAGENWLPDDAVVTGLVWGWHSPSALLVATRIEEVWPFINAFDKGISQVGATLP